MNNINYILEQLTKINIINSIIIIVVSFFIYKLIRHFIIKSEKNTSISKKLNNKSRTYLRLFNSILRYIFIVLTLLIILQINGIDVSSLLAGVGIAGVIVGLAIQDALKDIIRGFSLISDNYFSVGDVVSYGDIVGKVLVLGIKSTKIQDIATDNIISIANRNIEQIEVVSTSLYVKFPMPYEVPVDRAESVISEIVEEINKITDVNETIYKGVAELADSSILYLLKITCTPDRRLQVRRDSLRCILKTLENNNIQVPYNQLDIHQK